MELNQSNNKLMVFKGRRCISCGSMRPMKDKEFCYRCDPDRKNLPYVMPSFNKLTTVTGVRKAYGNILNALRKHKIRKDEASSMFYGLNCFIKSLKDIIDMKMSIDKTSDDGRSLITDIKIEQMKLLINKMETLHNKFTQSNIPQPTGEITQPIDTKEDTNNR